MQSPNVRATYPQPEYYLGDWQVPLIKRKPSKAIKVDDTGDIVLPNGVRPFCFCPHCNEIRNREVRARLDL